MKRLIVFFFCAAVVVFAVYQVVIYYDNNFQYGRMRETPGVREYENPLLIMEEGIVPVTGGEAVLRAADPAKLKSPINQADAKIIEAGQQDYLNYCAQCHGSNYDGKGTVGQSFHPLPTDLRSARIQSQTEGQLFQHISYGIGGGGRQPALHSTIRIQNRWGIVAFIKSLGPRS
jgi:mono/diheme cytochrome c family protein